MADINHIITLGIGTPGDIEHFILLGLNAVDLIFTGLDAFHTDTRRRIEALDALDRLDATEVKRRVEMLRVER